MKKLLIIPLFCLFSFVLFAQSNLVNNVNTLIGSKGLFLYGRTTPSVTPPFGMTHRTGKN